MKPRDERGFMQYKTRLLAWNHDPQQEIDQYTWHTSRDEGDKHSEAEPKRTDTKKLSQSTTDACDHTVPS